MSLIHVFICIVMFYYNDGPTTTLIFGQTLKTVHDRDKSSRRQNVTTLSGTQTIK